MSSSTPTTRQRSVSSFDIKFIFEKRTINSIDELELQTELCYQAGNIWNAIFNSNLSQVKRLLLDNKDLIYQRGSVGEIPLHLAFLYDSEDHDEIISYMLAEFPECVNEIYNKSEYYGETVLHIAIVNRRIDLVKMLIELSPSLINSRATGTFFQFGEPCYFGESPLAFAVCTRQKTLVEYLVKHGAPLNWQDSNGNSLLHMCVIHGLKEMFVFVLNLYKQLYGDTPIAKLTNNMKYTPFVLAAYLNKVDIIEFMMEASIVNLWSYGHLTCLLHPLEELDPIFKSDQDESVMGALQIMIYQSNLEMLSLPRIQEILELKWEKCASRLFFQRFFWTLIYIALFAFTCIIRRDTQCDQEQTADLCQHQYGATVVIRYIAEVLLFFGALQKMVRELKELMRMGTKYFDLKGSGLLENFLSLTFSTLLITAYVMRVLNFDTYDIPLALSSLASWMYIMFFLLGFRLTGPFIIMMYHMLVVDMVRFSLLVVVFYGGFAQTLYVIFRDNGFPEFFTRIQDLFMTMLGEFAFQTENYKGLFPEYVVVSLFVIICIIGIMLLNILMAMMSDTYGKILENADKQWMLERARITFAIQNEQTYEELMSPINRYWVDIKNERYMQTIIPNSKHYVPETFETEDSNRRILGLSRTDSRRKSRFPNFKGIGSFRISRAPSTEDAYQLNLKKRISTAVFLAPEMPSVDD